LRRGADPDGAGVLLKDAERPADNMRMEKCEQTFHERHESLTDRIYRTGGMLPDRYVFILTNLCNLSCPFCYQDRKRRPDALAAEDWIRFAGEIPDYARVTLTGGEPLLFPRFREVFRHVSERFDCNLLTNGLLLDEDLIEELLSSPRFRVLSVSIDDIGNTARKVPPERWERLVGLLRHFVRRRDRLGSSCLLDIKTTILDETAEEIPAIHRHCVEVLSCDTHVFQFLKGSPLQHADRLFSFDDALAPRAAPTYAKFDRIIEGLEAVREYNLRTGSVAYLHPKVASLDGAEPLPDLSYLNQSAFPRERFRPCRFPWSSVHVNVDGHVFPYMAISMGNIRDTSLAGINGGAAFARLRQALREQGLLEGCNRCGWLRPIDDPESPRGVGAP